jgi:hypothetical protein
LNKKLPRILGVMGLLNIGTIPISRPRKVSELGEPFPELIKSKTVDAGEHL